MALHRLVLALALALALAPVAALAASPVTVTGPNGAQAAVASNNALQAITPDASATGSITSTQSVTLTPAVGGYGAFGYQITGTWTGTIVVEATVDGTNWFSTTAIPATTAAVSSFTANSAGQGTLTGFTAVRLRGASVGSGTAVVTLKGSQGAGATRSGSTATTVTTAALGTVNSAVPTTADMIGLNSSGLLQPWTAYNPSGSIEAGTVDTTSIGGVTMAVGNGVSGTGVQRVTLASDGTGVVILGASTANIGVTGVAQASTTSGQRGEMAQCAVTTGAPSYTTAQTDPLSCDTSGNLRTTSTIAANSSVNVNQVAGNAVAAGNGVTTTGTMRVTLASDGTGKVGLNSTTASNLIGGVDLNSIAGGTGISTGNGISGAGNIRVNIAQDNQPVPVGSAQNLPLGTLAGPMVQCAATTSAPSDPNGNINPISCDTNGNIRVAAQPVPATTGGLSSKVIEPAASDNHAVVKSTTGQVYHIVVFNNSATINYMRLYNATTGFNGCNSATNLIWEGHIPANTADAGFVEDIAEGLAFSTGIAVCVTGAYGQTDTTNATASAISIDILYK